MNEILKELYNSEGVERVGFIKGSEIIEVQNISSEPFESFMVSTEDIMKYAEDGDATWHTHPNETSNLSSDDYVMIQNWKDMKHYIIGNDGVRCFKFDPIREEIIEWHE